MKEIGHLSARAKYPRRFAYKLPPSPTARTNLHFRRASNNLSRPRLLCRGGRIARGTETKRNSEQRRGKKGRKVVEGDGNYSSDHTRNESLRLEDDLISLG